MKRLLHDLYLFCVRSWQKTHSFGKCTIIFCALMLWWMGYNVMTIPIRPENQDTVIESVTRGAAVLYFVWGTALLCIPICYLIHKLRHK